jgi:hypothetical protein
MTCVEEETCAKENDTPANEKTALCYHWLDFDRVDIALTSVLFRRESNLLDLPIKQSDRD